MALKPIRKKMSFCMLSILFSSILLYAEDMRINNDSGTGNQLYPAIAMTESGMSVVCWEDYRNGNSDVYAQIYNRAGHHQGVNFRVHTASDSIQSSAGVAINQFGHITFVWDDRRNGHYDIYARMYEPNGIAKHAAFRVNDDLGEMAQRFSRIAMNTRGDYVICWLDTRQDSLPDVAFQLFASNGTRRGSNVLAVSETDESCLWTDVAMADNGDFVITWLQKGASGYYHLYAALYDSTGQETKPSYKVNSHPAQDANIIWQSVAMQTDGSFLISWMYAYEGEASQIFGKCFNAQGNVVRDQFVVNRTDITGSHFYPDVTAVPDSGYVVAWSMQETNQNVYACEFDREGQPVDLPYLITDAAGDQFLTALAADARGITICAWQDNREGNLDIYANFHGPHMPMDVQAGHELFDQVTLAWRPIFGDVTPRTYYIYRATDPTALFELVAVVNTADRPYPNLMHDWIDTDVNPGTTYYYQLDCDSPDITRRSKIVSARPLGYANRIHFFWAESTPAIDGVIESGEYGNVPNQLIGGWDYQHPISARMMNDDNTLYIGIDDPGDTTLNNANAFGMLFDEDNDNTWDPSGFIGEGRFDVVPSGAYFTPFYGDYPNIGLGATIGAEGVISAVSIASGHVQYEIAIDLTESPLQALPGETFGAVFWINDPGNVYPIFYGNAAEYPQGVLWDAALPLADLELAVEIDTTINLSWPMLDGGPRRNRWAEDENQLTPPFGYDTTITPWDNLVDFSVLGSTLIAGVGGDPITIHAYDLNQDSVLWSFEIPGSEGALSCQPAVNDSLVVCGGQGGDGLYALDRWTGAVKWMRPMGSLHIKHPILEDNHVFISDDSLYCLDQKDGTTTWAYPHSGSSTQKTPAVGGRYCIWVIDDSVLCLDKRNGERKWSVYNQGRSNCIAIDEDHIYVLQHDSLTARWMGDGSRYWSAFIENQDLISWSENNLAVSDSVVCLSILGNTDQPGELLTFNRLNGELLWQHVFDTLRVDPPFIVNGNIYTINQSDLYGFDAWTGIQTFYYESVFVSDAAVANHAIYISDWQGIRVLSNEPPDARVKPAVQTAGFQLYANYPNPFNPVTQITYDVGRQGHVRLTVYNLLGQEVIRLVDSIQEAGYHSILLDGNTLSSGVYIYQIVMDGLRSTKKMVLIR